MRFIAILLAMVLGLSGAARAEGLTVYVFGNSLIHHLTDSDETTAPHWMAYIAEADGQPFALDGQWGFLRDFAKDETPQANWRFRNVPRGWTRQFRNFEDVSWDVVMFNPANFIQYKSAAQPYDGTNDDGSSPLSASLKLIDRMTAEATPDRFVLYEGWADMGSFVSSFPPNRRQMRRYQRYNAGKYHDWYVDYLDQMRAERPDVQIDMIPVATILAGMINGGVLDGIDPLALYSDDSPHGTATLYFLAGAVAYAGLYERPLPDTFEVPESIDVVVRENFAAIRDVIHEALLNDEQAAAAAPTPVEVATGDALESFPTPAPVPGAANRTQQGEAGLGLADPALAMGLSVVADWSTQQPFIDRMKTARTWVGHLPDRRWGGVTTDDLLDRGLMDEEGWVWGIPEDIDAVEALLLTDQQAEAAGLAGRYRVTWQGQGELSVTGRARVIRREEGNVWFEYTPGDGLVGIRIESTDPDGTGDYIRDIHVVAEAHVALFEAGAMFNPDWINVVNDLRMVRFMDWMRTNGSTQDTWANRPQVSDFTWTWRGVPVEVMVQLANEIGADPWFNMPHLADEMYVRRFAEYVRDHLDPGLIAYTEYSNEVWNWGFLQAQYAMQQAEAIWGEDASHDAWMQYAGLRAAEMGRIWAEVFGRETEDRVVRVAATHTDWPGLEKGLLEAPLAVKDGASPPHEFLDAYAVSGYFGIELGMDDGAPLMIERIKAAEAKARKAGEDQGLQRAALDAYIDIHRYDGMHRETAEVLRKGSLTRMLEEILPGQVKAAGRHGLSLVMYEGGSHAVGVGEWANKDELTAYFEDFSASDELGTLYDELLAGWTRLGGGPFNAYSDVGPTSKWGSWGHKRHLWDSTARFEALMAYNQQGTHWRNDRAEGVFQHGGIFTGTDGPDRLTGTPKRDDLLGGRGDDVLVANGPGDRLHGGPGTDQALLPGDRFDYAFNRQGPHIRALGIVGDYLLTDIETVGFADNEGLELLIEEML
ncbi:type I secretion protein [Shimia abyssi]|uniref:Hemolysin type calcium-binding protein n=1 Tax=Shimia abyssi TaxID=1662395 RepID=A0A2P8FBW5_9RHOB|nr:type I secretion protein [Shimia abyssi]PSL19162.1 hypothetical protein CLV88_107105 [Shimia abyssi]